MTNKYMKKILFFAVSIGLLSCNPAEDGFNAPSGSTVTAVPESFSYSLPATGTAGSCSTFIGLVTFQVHIPIGTQQPTIPEIDNANLQPGNNINGVILATGNIDIYRFKDGVQTFNRDLSLADPVPSGTYSFVTDDRGLYHVIWTQTECYDSNGDLVPISGGIDADIGVAHLLVTVTVSGG